MIKQDRRYSDPKARNGYKIKKFVEIIRQKNSLKKLKFVASSKKKSSKKLQLKNLSKNCVKKMRRKNASKNVSKKCIEKIRNSPKNFAEKIRRKTFAEKIRKIRRNNSPKICFLPQSNST